MQVTEIAGKEFTTIASMKQFAIEQGMDLKGSSKWLKTQWVENLESFMEVRAEIIAIAVDAEEVSQDASAQIETAVISVGSLIVAALTSEQAIDIYRQSLKFVVFAIVITWMFAVKAAEWCWANRDRTAVYRWVKDAIGSRWGLRLRTEVLGLVLVSSVVIDDCRAKYRESVDRALVRLGLGGGAIEVQ